MYIPEAMFYPRKEFPILSKENDSSAIHESQEKVRRIVNHKLANLFESTQKKIRPEVASKVYHKMTELEENFPEQVKKNKEKGITTQFDPNYAKNLRDEALLQESEIVATILETTPYLTKIQELFFKTIIALLECFGIDSTSTGYLKEIHKHLSDEYSNHHLRVYHETNKKINRSQMEAVSHRNVEIENPKSRALMTVHSTLSLQSQDLEKHEALPDDQEEIERLTAEQAYSTHQKKPKVDNFEVAELGTLIPYSIEITNVEGQLIDNVVAGQVTPTSIIHGGVGVAKKDHLTNIYVIDLGGEKAVIRSGKIDSKQSADDFIAILLMLHEKYVESSKNPNFKMRIVSQQLNSFEGEEKIISDQHRMIAYINSNDKLKDKAEVVHLSTPSNGWYHKKKWFKSWGLLGIVRFMLRIFWDVNSFKGEKLSKQLNLEGMATYMNWLTEDLGKSIEMLPVQSPVRKQLVIKLDELHKSNKKKNHLKSFISNEMLSIEKSDGSHAVKLMKANLKEHRAELKDLLNQDAETLKNIRQIIISNGAVTSHVEFDKVEVYEHREFMKEIEKEIQTKMDTSFLDKVIEEGNLGDIDDYRIDDNLNVQNNTEYKDDIFLEVDEMLNSLTEIKSSMLQKVSLMSQILESQVGKSQVGKTKLDRGQEGMMIQMLSDKLGVTFAMNCLSGLDRTGLWHAVKLSMLTLETDNNLGAKNMFDLVNHWKETTDLMNKMTANQNRYVGELFSEDLDLDFSRRHEIFGDLISENVDLVRFKEIRQNILNVLNFRNEVLKNLIKIGIPITTTSTGVMGLKWGSGFVKKNLIPLNFLPSHVKNENGDIVPLVKYNSEGNVEKIKKAGRLMLTKFQDFRKH